MTILQFALLGLGSGSAYALLAIGLVLIHRGSAVVNFAHGAMAMVAGFVFYELSMVRGVSPVLAGAIAVAIVAVLGALIYQVVMRRLLNRSSLARIIATLGILVLIQSTCSLIWGDVPKQVTSVLPTDVVRIGELVLGGDRLWMIGIGVIVTIGLWALVSFTDVGIALRANAENPVAASALGWSSHAMGTLTWTVGGGLAGLAGVLIVPLTGVDVGQTPFLVIPALAATLIGRFKSFPITLVAALGIGVLQSLVARYSPIPGSAEALPFLVILVVFILSSEGIKERRQAVEQLPALGTGRVRPIGLPVTALVVIGFLFLLPLEFVYSLTTTTAWGIVMLSVVVLLGYTGQLSLAQAAIAGIAALIAGRLASDLGAPFLIALLLAVLLTIPVGLLFALPALKTKGANLAVITLGLAVTCSALVFNSYFFTGGAEGTPVGYPEIFGLEIDGQGYPIRYAIVVIIAFTICALVATNIRRGAAGRRLIAVRTNERAAAALGVNIFSAKLFAFGLAAGIAAVGGVLIAFRNPVVLYGDFAALNSILVIAYAVVGGVGYIFGAVNGGLLVAGGLGGWIMHAVVPGASPVWLSIVGGLLVTLLVVVLPNGLVVDQIKIVNLLGGLFAKLFRRRTARPSEQLIRPEQPIRVEPKTLAIEGLTVRFGGVTAVDDVGTEIRPGEVLGLIGPNGAGKTTTIDAITGFVGASEGRVVLDGEDITRTPVHVRARLGVARSFQSLELFDSSTVRENLRIASDGNAFGIYLRDLVFPKKEPLSPTAAEAVDMLGLEDNLDTLVSELSYGRRRLVAIARAIATAPSVLLLDEPAAGLGEEETTALGQIVKDLARNWGIAVLVVEHDMSFVMSVCDRITVLDFGKQIASDTPDEIRRNAAVVAAYLGGADDAGDTETEKTEEVSA